MNAPNITMTIDLGQVLFGLAAFATAIFPILSWLASKRNAKNIATVTAKVDAVAAVADATHIATNSLSERTEGLARAAGVAEGNLQGREQQTAERKAEEDDRQK